MVNSYLLVLDGMIFYKQR